MKEVVKLIEKVVSEKRIDRHQGLNALLDFFGGIYEEMYQSRSKSSTLGQFFTPPAVCDLLAYCSEPIEGKISDCACGSGRTLLAAGAESGFSRDNYYVGEDLDLVSVKMCALNLMIHGCRGRVVQHDTLMNPICYDYGFRINDIRFPMPTPFYSLTRIRFTKDDLEKRKEAKSTHNNKEECSRCSTPTQLSLF